MTKEDKIREVYGIFYEEFKPHIDENGRLTKLWTSIHYLNKFKQLKELIDKSNIDFYGENYALPKALSGITNNNEWIQFGGNHPNESNWYWIKTNSDMLVAFWANHKNAFIDMDNSIYFNDVTHYQSIEEPKPPLY